MKQTNNYDKNKKSDDSINIINNTKYTRVEFLYYQNDYKAILREIDQYNLLNKKQKIEDVIVIFEDENKNENKNEDK